MNAMMMIETGDMEHPRMISVFPYPEMPEGYTHGENFNFVDGVRVPFGRITALISLEHRYMDNLTIQCLTAISMRD